MHISFTFTGLKNNPPMRSKYAELAEKIERMSKIFHFILVKFTLPGFILPALFLTIINYFIHDLGNESYYLPCPLM